MYTFRTQQIQGAPEICLRSYVIESEDWVISMNKIFHIRFHIQTAKTIYITLFSAYAENVIIHYPLIPCDG